MRRFNHSSNAASSYRPRMASLTAADTSWSIQMLLEEPANERTPDVSGAWPAVSSDTMELDALLEEDLVEDDSCWDLSEEELEICEDGSSMIQPEQSVVELSDDALIEVEEELPRRAPKPRKPSLRCSQPSSKRAREAERMEARLAATVVAAGKGRLAAAVPENDAVVELNADELVDVIESTIALQDGDLEVLEPDTGRMESTDTGTVLYYCRPGDSLPPALVPTSELPRFAVPRGRLPQLPERLPQFSIVEALPATSKRVRAGRLPQFSIPPEPVRKPRVPPVRLPRFPIEEMAPSRPRPPAPRRLAAPLPRFATQWPLAAVPQAWPLYQAAAASGSWPVHQSGEYPACPHCREQMLLAAAWSAGPALFGWGHR